MADTLPQSSHLMMNAACNGNAEVVLQLLSTASVLEPDKVSVGAGSIIERIDSIRFINRNTDCYASLSVYSYSFAQILYGTPPGVRPLNVRGMTI